MNPWRSQLYLKIGRQQNIAPEVLANAIGTARITTALTFNVPPILTLRHLCHLCNASYPQLRRIIGRRSSVGHYRTFAIQKRDAKTNNKQSGGKRASKSQPPIDRRIISVPEPGLIDVQRWLAQNVLAHVPTHSASQAFAPGCNTVNAARLHCGALWLVKIDVRGFFESISELSVYRVFLEIGYQPLVAFELARLCTRPRSMSIIGNSARWRIRQRSGTPPAYQTRMMGYLPQGAPTSPMLANLAVKRLDKKIEAIAAEFGMAFGRYADDFTFSTKDSLFSRRKAGDLINRVYAEFGRHGLTPNTAKTAVIPPGARKVVLGLLVDGDHPRLTRQFRFNMRQHLHYLLHPDYGAAQHASCRNFQDIAGLRNHLYGLISFANQVDPIYADQCRSKLDSVRW